MLLLSFSVKFDWTLIKYNVPASSLPLQKRIWLQKFHTTGWRPRNAWQFLTQTSPSDSLSTFSRGSFFSQ